MKKLMAAFMAAFFMAAPAWATAPVTIYFDGDSTTWGYHTLGGTPVCNDGAATTGCVAESYGHNVAGGTALQEPYNEPAEVLLQMNLAFGQGAVAVENHGVGGATVLDSINGSADPISGDPEYDCSTVTNPSNTCGSLGARLQASHARIVVGHFLTNDQYRMTPAQFQSYVSTWITTVKGLKNADGQTMIPVWEESAPICRNDAPDVGPFLTAMRTAAANEGALLVSQHDWIYQNIDWKPMLSDCIHPDVGLYSLMGDRLSSALSLTVQKLLSP